jgi:hypothetical protein
MLEQTLKCHMNRAASKVEITSLVIHSNPFFAFYLFFEITSTDDELNCI